MRTLIHNILQPAFSRVGTIAATWLVANGLEQQHAVTVETAITALGLFALDLAVRAFFKGRAR